MGAIKSFFASLLSGFILLSMFTGLYNPRVRPFKPGRVDFPVYEGGTLTIDDRYVIVRGADAIPAEVTAAEKLQSLLKEISGVELEIVTDDVEAQAKEIVIGDTNRHAPDYAALGEEGFVIKAVEEAIVIAGGRAMLCLHRVGRTALFLNYVQNAADAKLLG